MFKSPNDGAVPVMQTALPRCITPMIRFFLFIQLAAIQLKIHVW